MDSAIGRNFLLAFDYDLPKPPDEVRQVLYIHSIRPESSRKCLLRLMDLYPQAKFLILTAQETCFPKIDSDRISVSYFQDFISEDFHQTEEGKKLAAAKIDLAFFSLGISAFDLIGFREKYSNIYQCLELFGYRDISYAVDKDFQVRPLPFFKDCMIPLEEKRVNGATLHLPWTLLFPGEIAVLFELARSGPSEGAIVNIGHYRGGSSIILAKGSKEKGREKVYSFDPKRYDDTDEALRKNQVEDWIVFEQMRSGDAVMEWARREDTRIRLLFVDGDHSYLGCKSDILNFAPFLVPGGVIAVHDYCNTSLGWTLYTPIVEAVYDTILSGDGFRDFRRDFSIFSAKKV
ncbi:MAG: class I SAM-dependent methyltransferase [Nitrospinales bacterium]